MEIGRCTVRQPAGWLRHLPARSRGLPRRSFGSNRRINQQLATHKPAPSIEISPKSASVTVNLHNRQNTIEGGESPSRPDETKPTPGKRRVRPVTLPNLVRIDLDLESREFSSLLLRDLCTCPRCVDPSTRQKLFSTVAIPEDVQAVVEPDDGSALVSVRWQRDIPGFGPEHVSHFERDTLLSTAPVGSTPQSSGRVLWDAEPFRQNVGDIQYDAYMSDDSVLYQALQHLQTHGLMFLVNVPDSEKSVATIAERIGPLKNTFYGNTWDVRSVPQAKNVAYTSQDLGFHMDLLYMEQPPHLQFLHCIRSSSSGGASLFTDSYKAAQDLFASDLDAFMTLTKLPVAFHYNHQESHYYHRSRFVFELDQPLLHGRVKHRRGLQRLVTDALETGEVRLDDLDVTQWLDAVSWAPPFQAPFAVKQSIGLDASISDGGGTRALNLDYNIKAWHAAAKKFNSLIHRHEAVYERMMKPGECVIFDNRRVLHARKAFEVGDQGKERWLRGAYVDRDPYRSKMRVLQEKLGKGKEGKEEYGVERLFQALEARAGSG